VLLLREFMGADLLNLAMMFVDFFFLDNTYPGQWEENEDTCYEYELPEVGEIILVDSHDEEEQVAQLSSKELT
jgi:hypothetical protein